jgi:hypothetical protein
MHEGLWTLLFGHMRGEVIEDSAHGDDAQRGLRFENRGALALIPAFSARRSFLECDCVRSTSRSALGKTVEDLKRGVYVDVLRLVFDTAALLGIEIKERGTLKAFGAGIFSRHRTPG